MRFIFAVFLHFYSMQLNQDFIYGSLLPNSYNEINATSNPFKVIDIGSNVSENSLVCVQAVWRHGARMQLSTFPNDEYNPSVTKVFGNAAIGQLTLEGVIGSQRLGIHLRSRYSNFLAKNFSLTELFLVSSGTHRTVMTALAVAQGLFPTSVPNSENGNDAPPLWYPVPVMSIPATMDNYILQLRKCNRYSQLYKQYKNSSKFYTEDSVDLYSYLSFHSGHSVEDYEDVYYLLDTIFFSQRDLFRLPVPDWASPVEHQMTDLSRYEITGYSDSFEMMRFVAGPLLYKIIYNFNCTLGIRTPNSGDDCKYTKMYGFSGHDTTIAPLLKLFGHYNIDSPPPFNALLLIELHQNETKYFIRIFYRPKNDKAEDPSIELLLKSCGNVPCEFKRFQEIYKQFIIDDATYQKYCENEPSTFINRENSNEVRQVHGNNI